MRREKVVFYNRLIDRHVTTYANDSRINARQVRGALKRMNAGDFLNYYTLGKIMTHTHYKEMPNGGIVVGQRLDRND